MQECARPASDVQDGLCTHDEREVESEVGSTLAECIVEGGEFGVRKEMIDHGYRFSTFIDV
jgi:hypothetical protein